MARIGLARYRFNQRSANDFVSGVLCRIGFLAATRRPIACVSLFVEAARLRPV